MIDAQTPEQGPPPEAAPPLHPSLIPVVLNHVTRALDLPQPPAEADATEHLTPQARLDALRTAAAAAGLACGVHVWSPREAIRLVDADRPLIAPVTTDSGSPAWVIVGPAPGPLAKVTLLRGDHSHTQLMDPEGLSELLGLSSPGSTLRWLGVEPALTLSPIGAQPGEAAPTPARRLLRLLFSERSTAASVVVYALFSGLLALATPIAVQGLVTSVAFGTVLQPLIVLTVLLGAALAFSGLTRVLEIVAVELLQQRLFVRAAMDLAHRLPRVRPGTYQAKGKYGPDLVNRFFDVVTAQKATASLLLSALDVVLQTGLGMLLLAFYHPWLLAFDLLLVGAIVTLIALGRGATDTALKESSAKYEVAAWLEELARVPSSFLTPGARGLAASRADELASRYLLARRAHFRIVLRQTVGGLGTQVVASAALLGLGGWLVIEGQLSLGQLVAAELVVTMVVSGLARFSKYLESYYDLLASMDKVGSLVDLPLESASGRALPLRQEPASLEFFWGDDPAQRLTLAPGGKRLTGALDAEQRRQLFGGAWGLSPIGRGKLKIDGIDAADLSPEGLRGDIALLARPQLFAGTVLENLTQGGVTLSEATARDALRTVGLLQTVDGMPHGLMTRLLPGESAPPAEFIARLEVARVLVRRPRLVLVDAALDPLPREVFAPLVELLLKPDAPWTALVYTGRDASLDGSHVTLNPSPSEGADHV